MTTAASPQNALPRRLDPYLEFLKAAVRALLTDAGSGPKEDAHATSKSLRPKQLQQAIGYRRLE